MGGTPQKYKFYVMEIGGDGPNRIMGTKGYWRRIEASDAAEQFLRQHPHRAVTVFETHETMWVDQKPVILNDAPKAGPAEPHSPSKANPS